jgi:hypothetical protein
LCVANIRELQHFNWSQCRAALFWLPLSILLSPDLPANLRVITQKKMRSGISQELSLSLFGSSYPANRKPKDTLCRREQFNCANPELE